MDSQPTIDVFVLGEAACEPSIVSELNGYLSVKLIPTGATSVAEFARIPLAAKLLDGESSLVAIAADPMSTTIKDIAVATFFVSSEDPQHSSPAAHLTVERIDLSRFELYLGVSAGLQILYAPRARHRSIVFSRQALREIGPLRDLTEPVWDWVIRAYLVGQRVELSAIEGDPATRAASLPLLAPPRRGNEANWLREHLATAPLKKLGCQFKSKADEIGARAGLFQWHDFLEESHQLSQSIEGEGENQRGDYWHAIMHRREPDYSNAKYWFRRVGNQPTYRDLRPEADGILAECPAPEAALWRDRLQEGSKWNALAFVDLCHECAGDETSDLAIAARKIQYAEMCLLM